MIRVLACVSFLIAGGLLAACQAHNGPPAADSRPTGVDPNSSGVDSQAAVKDEDPPLSAVRVNQVGYFPGGTKLATLLSAEPNPLPFYLEHKGRVVFSGETTKFGADADSGDSLHWLDFSGHAAPGDEYVLRVGQERSPPFSIANDLYASLKYDALRYFYHNRSGIAIEMPYAMDEKWTRPAGHLESDRAVGCAADVDCDYELSVIKGWYDAGDHGKYVVNGGIAVWTMMNQYERFKAFGKIEAFGDGKLLIPESSNAVPDLLDEARWEMEFILGMQVPDGNPLAGMAHHKMHDTTWTALGLAPHEAEKRTERKLRPVSTAATLNLAATAAQASRLFKEYDSAFAARCLHAAEKAYRAAQQHKELYASAEDGKSGGGPYADGSVGDEFFWAAAELYVSTKNVRYRKDMEGSVFYRSLNAEVDGAPSTMAWPATGALGTISLAVVPDAVTEAEQAALRALLIARADEYLTLTREQGYSMPFASSKDGGYPWGSNSFVVNNMLIMALAYDFTREERYLQGVVLGMDYLLGRNAMGQSFVTGYGTRPLRHPHHRFWAAQLDPKYPPAPPGALSGGPNSGLQDDRVQAVGLAGCAPQKCFLDHIDAWSVNEITINWNAPLAWVAAFLDENPPTARPAIAIPLD